MRLAEPPIDLLNGASLFLDFDGTIVELAARPDAVEVGPELLELLLTLQDKLDGRVVLLSGRPIDDVSRFLDPLRMRIGGSHGIERTTSDGRRTRAPRPAGLDQVIGDLRRLESEHEGVLIEEKPAGVAIHYRLARSAEEACHAAAEKAASAAGLALQHGKMVVELKPANGDKGTAIRAFMSEPPFEDTRPVFIGDDLTDEHGFAAALDLSGAGVLVGKERATAARYRLSDVSAVRSWLWAACGALA